MADPAGASAVLFDEMTRRTIARFIAQMSTDELLELMGHIIVRSRAKSAERE
jgi:pheromone shutdown protein TraB